MSQIDKKDQVNESGDDRKERTRKRVTRIFPALSYEDCLSIGEAIWKYASGSKIRRLTLFDQMGKSPESGPSRTLITSSSKYGIISGTTQSEYIELTEQGVIATSEDTSSIEKTRVHFELAIKGIDYLYKLYGEYKGLKLPSRQVLMDFLNDSGLEGEDLNKCVDLFLVNARYIGLIKVLSGAERIISIEQLLEETDCTEKEENASNNNSGGQNNGSKQPLVLPSFTETNNTPSMRTKENSIIHDFDKVCFYISPIGDIETEQRKHADLFLGSIIEPALEEFGLEVIRADSINAAGTITAQIIEYIVKSKIVIADLSYHNPNVFYELSLRHTLARPIIHLIRKCDAIPFDVHSFRTIIIDTTNIYTLVPQIDSYRTAISAQIRQLLENPQSADNPIAAVLEKHKKDK